LRLRTFTSETLLATLGHRKDLLGEDYEDGLRNMAVSQLFLTECANVERSKRISARRTCWFQPKRQAPDGIFPSVAYLDYRDKVQQETIRQTEMELASFRPERRICQEQPVWKMPPPGTSLHIFTWGCDRDDWRRTALAFSDHSVRGLHLSVIRNVSCSHARTRSDNFIPDPWGKPYSQDWAHARQSQAFAMIPAAYLLDSLPQIFKINSSMATHSRNIVAFVPSFRWLGWRLASRRTLVVFSLLFERLFGSLEDSNVGATVVCDWRSAEETHPCAIYAHLFEDACPFQPNYMSCQPVTVAAKPQVLASANKFRWEVASDMRWMYRNDADALDMLALLTAQAAISRGLDVRFMQASYS